MTHPRLIFVEGLPGSGKSTTAQRLALHLRRHGVRARWIFEHEREHPLGLNESALRALREQSPSADPTLLDHALAACTALATTTDTLVFDGALFQLTAATQLLLDQPVAAITRHFDATLAALAPAGPTLIHLRAADPVAALTATAQARGPWFVEFLVTHLAATPLGRRLGVSDPSGALEIMTRHHALGDELFARFPGPKLSLDPSAGDWGQHNTILATFLDLPPLTEPAPDPVAAVAAAAAAGTYRAPTGDSMTFVVTPRGLGLDDPDRDDAPPTPLWTRPEGGYEVAGLALEINFCSATSGQVTHLRCAPRLTDLPPVWQRV